MSRAAEGIELSSLLVLSVYLDRGGVHVGTSVSDGAAPGWIFNDGIHWPNRKGREQCAAIVHVEQKAAALQLHCYVRYMQRKKVVSA